VAHHESMALECHVELRADAARVLPIGELDLETAPLVDECLDDVRAAGITDIVVDLGETSLVDSAGLHLMLEWHERARREEFAFALTRCTHPVRQTIRAAGIGARLTFVGPAP
jgi:anti-sigma B factor antagonist